MEESEICKINIYKKTFSHYKYIISKNTALPILNIKRSVKLPFGEEWTWEKSKESETKFFINNNKKINDLSLLNSFKNTQCAHLKFNEVFKIIAKVKNKKIKDFFVRFCINNNINFTIKKL